MTDKNKSTAISEAKNKLRSAKTTKLGVYMFAVSLILLAVLIAVNLLASLLPDKLTVIDTSTNKIFTLSSGTQRFLDSLENDISIKWVCQNGTTDETMLSFLERYDAASPNISFKVIDPLKEPDALIEYDTSAISNYSLIVESRHRVKILDISEMFKFYNEYLMEQLGMGEVSQDIYNYYQQYFYIAEQSGYPTDTLFCGEDVITKAVEYVNLEYIPHIYILEGHGEVAFSEILSNFISSGGIAYETLKLTDSVPVDAGCIVINAPESDLTEQETLILKKYLAEGGNLLLITSPESLTHKNLLSLMNEYGLSAISGTVHETSADHYSDKDDALIPNIAESDITGVASSNGYTIIMPSSHAISTESAAGAEILFSTSENAYIQNGEQKSELGQFALAAAASKGESRVIWYSSSDAFTDEPASIVSGGNYYYLFYSLYWLNDTYESALENVEGVSLINPTLDGLLESASTVYILAAVFIIIIPATALTCGLVVWIRRKKR